MGRLRTWIGSLKPGARIALVAATLVVLGAALLGVANATDQPWFCRSVCHEMRPYHEAWTQGPHADTGCIECHVDPGQAARLAHKYVALQEVWSHWQGDILFPRPETVEVPDARCVRCHEVVKAADASFDHDLHATKDTCAGCHIGIGHEVTVEALKAAGIYAGSPSATSSIDASRVAFIDGGTQNLSGHVAEACSRCHDMARTGCAACHEAEHDPMGDCEVCHLAGPTWAFTHPTTLPDCGSCHDVPTDHAHEGTCGECHTEPGESWGYAHAGDTGCARCHAAPAEHPDGECGLCHAAGVSWAFRHPTSTRCADCHDAPANHYGSNCASCHSAGRAWQNAVFRHPGIAGGEHSYRSYPCAYCHPSDYGSATCVRCHDSASGPSEGDDD